MSRVHQNRLKLGSHYCMNSQYGIENSAKMSKIFMVVVLCTVYFHQSYSICNITALTVVNAITYDERGIGERHFGVNFNVLDDYRTIDLTTANVSELCEGMVKNFTKLEVLNFIHVNISKIGKRAFQDVPRLTKLSLAVNYLKEINDEDLNYIKSLKVLYLSMNQIHFIEDKAFDNMPNLERIYLDRNRITSISGNWFKNTGHIKEIDLSHNKITSIPRHAFKNILPKLRQEEHTFVQYRLSYNSVRDISTETLEADKDFLILRLEGNGLRHISDDVFRNLKNINSLVLNSNHIDCLSEEILSTMKTTAISIHLVNNPISCDCVDKFDKNIEEGTLLASFYFNTTFNCALLKQPKYLSDLFYK